MHRLLALAACCPLAFAAAASTPPNDPAVVESTGAATFRIPVELPPGPGGFAPDLALVYSSRAGDGPFGVGWGLALPEVRCSARRGAPDFASCPLHELGDTLLVPDPATPGRYHTFVESWQRITHDAAADAWTVERPDGTKLFFGGAASHRVASGGATARWLLARMEDAFGNAIHFGWDRADAGAPLLAAVTYGAGAGPGAGPREVRFVYEPRPDAALHFAGGVEARPARRAREIQVFGHGQIARRTVLGYAAPGTHATERSRLAWVQEFGSDCADPWADPVASCAGLPPRTLTYTDAGDVAGPLWPGDDAYRMPVGDYSAVNPSIWRNGVPQLVGDLDGDGLPDRIELLALKATEPAEVRVWINTGQGFAGSGGADPSWTAIAYEESLASLTYDRPRLEFEQVPAQLDASDGDWWVDDWNAYGTVYAMCSVRMTQVPDVPLVGELLPRGVGSVSSSWADLQASGGAPSPGFVEPRPSLRLVDLDADGRAELVVSTRLSGAMRDADCDPASPESVPDAHLVVVFRNTGSGWVHDAAAQALGEGLPPFEAVVVKSSYRTQMEERWPLLREVPGYLEAHGPCANASVRGFEQSDDQAPGGPDPAYLSGVCHNWIELAPHFADFDGDGHPDLAVLVRDDPTLFWTGTDYWSQQQTNPARTRVWVQRPGESPRWQRAPQYDLPFDAWPASYRITGFAHVGLTHRWAGPDEWSGCYSWSSYFESCGPNTYRADLGVRLVDVNADGLTDVVWSSPDEGEAHAKGVLLNTGGGDTAQAFAAWCRSGATGAAWVARACPGAARYEPPVPLAEWMESPYNNLPTTTGLLADFNGDGLPDLVRLHYYALETATWIHSPGPAPVWRRDARFDFPIDWGREVPHPILGHPVTHGEGQDTFVARFDALDVDGDGSADLVGDLHAFRSQARHPDLVRAMNNGRGGAIEIGYASAIAQRTLALESLAASVVWADAAGDVALWRPTPLVARVRVSGPNLAAPGHVTDYAYAHPRFCPEHRSDQGFGLVVRTQPDGSLVREWFYQDHGRAGRSAQRHVAGAAGGLVRRVRSVWEHAPAPPPGAIAGVFVARLVSEERANLYGGVEGALWTRTFGYADAGGAEHGYGFVHGVTTSRPTGTLVETRLPDTDTAAWVVGRLAERTLTDAAGDVLAATRFGYVDLDGDPSGARVASRSDWIAERRAAGGAWVETLARRYDAYGNVTDEVTPSPLEGEDTRTTSYCYDGDTASWCPQGVGHSRGVRVGERDPLGKVTRTFPDLRTGAALRVESDWHDVPATRVEPDPFGRPRFEWATPHGGAEVLLAESVHHDAPGEPARVERFAYTEEDQSAWTFRAIVSDGFGGTWKRIESVPSGAYVGVASWVDPANATTRTTRPVPCADAACTALIGDVETAAREVASDALGRPRRVDTPDGFSLLDYRAGVDRPLPPGLGEPGALDVVLEKNAKGGLVQRWLDGERETWIDECHGGVAPSTASLAGVACGSADTTLRHYEASGEDRAVFDARAVAAGDWGDPDHALRYVHDTLGRVVRIADPALEGTGEHGRSYHASGALLASTNARGQTRSFAYDRLGRLVAVATPAGETDYALLYRPNERARWMDLSDAYRRTYVHDDWGRVRRTRLEVASGARSAGVEWTRPYLTDTRYDLAGRPVEIVHPDATTVRYEYGAGAAGAHLERVCDLGGASDCAGWGAFDVVSDVAYDALGRRVAVETPAGTRSFAYAPDSDRLAEEHFAAAGDPFRYDLVYEAYDELGKLERVSGSTSAGDVDMHDVYAYDARGRLASWTKQGQTYEYAYDELGNPVLHAGVVQAFDDPGRPHAVQRRGGGPAFAYDADGNRVSSGDGRHHAFDSASRLVCMGSAPGACDDARIHYDVDGRRVLDELPRSGGRVVHVGDSARVRGDIEVQLEIRAFGERVATRRSFSGVRLAGAGGAGLAPTPLALGAAGALALFAAALAWRPRPALACGLAGLCVVGPAPLGCGAPPSLLWELADRVGTTKALVDGAGARRMQATLTPHGEIHEIAGPERGARRYYGGHLRDRASGLVSMGARWMDPATGSFVSIDPVVPSASDPQSLNAYAYARHDPVNLTDPDGACVLMFSCGMILPTGTLVSLARTTVTMSITDGAGNTMSTTSTTYSHEGTPVGSGFHFGGPKEWAPAGPIAGAAALLQGFVDLLVGESFGKGWVDLFGPWGRGPTGGVMPKAWARELAAVRAAVPANARANGMHAWHAGSNAALGKKLGLAGAPLILLAGILHETPLDPLSFGAELRFQGVVNQALDSVTDVAANAFGLVLGYALPRGMAVDTAISLGNHIPGPGEPDPAFGGAGPYTGNPLRDWGHYP